MMIIFWIVTVMLLSFAKGDQFYATPLTTSPCPTEATTCFSVNSLNNYSTTSQIFSTNSVVTFLSGTHTITNNVNSLLIIKDVQNLTLTGDSEEKGASEIVCEEPFAIVFINVTRLTISNLTLTNCSSQTNKEVINDILSHIAQPYFLFSPLEYVALFMVHIVDFEMSHVTVRNNTGYGLLAFNIIGESSISHSTFVFNNFQAYKDVKCKLLSTIESKHECSGGGLALGYADTADCLSGTNFINISSTFISHGANPSSAAGGIAIVMSQSSYGVHVNLDNIFVTNNSAPRGANIYLDVFGVTYDSTITLSNSFSGYSNPFNNNMSVLTPENDMIVGGGLFYSFGRSVPTAFGETSLCSMSRKLYESDILTVSNTTFVGNKAITGAGAYVRYVYVQSVNFPSQIKFEDCSFTDNIGVQGSAIFLNQLEPIESELLTQFHFNNCNISSNTYPSSDAVDISLEVEYDVFTTVSLGFIQDVSFTSCRFSKNVGSALYSYSTRMRFYGNVIFERNQGTDGGALAIHGNSLMIISTNTSIKFVHNSALRGGAIYIANQNYRAKVLCFWQIDHSSLEEFGIPIEISLLNRSAQVDVDIQRVLDIHLDFYNNTAEVAGSAIYGGNIDRCLLVFSVNHRGYSSGKIFDNLFTFVNQTSNENVTTSLISSDPTRVCFCTNDVYDCNKSIHHISLYPGQSFVVSVVTVGQRNEISPGAVFALLKPDSIAGPLDTSGILGESQILQQSGKTCTNVRYTILSTLTSLSLMLRSVNTFFENTQTQVLITLDTCPLGFRLSREPPMCVCGELLDAHNVECNIENQTIHRVPPTWIGKEKDSAQNNSGESDHVLFHDYCPFDYCVPSEFELTILNQDMQCAHNRTGTVCGSCSPGLSMTLGSNYCLECSNNYLLLVVVFAAVGVLLVCSLYLCNTLNVSFGTLNGLIFYANIIQINKELFFPPDHYNLATVFIAWLNLDLGIRTCFYDGMDTYAKTWLQFAFPLYILTIVTLIIIVSHYSASVSKLFSKNAVQVLATILLLLFSKGQRILINCLSYTTLRHSGYVTKVWLFDANIPYLQGKHIYLFIVGNVLFFIILTPFTLVLLFSRYLQALSTHRAFHWVNKLKPLFDAYMAPYKDNYRYWAGLLLFVRGALFIVYAFNILYGPDVILLTTAIVTQLLSIFTWFSGGMYKKWPLNALEFSFFLNLSILSTTTIFVRKVHGYQEGIVYTSVTIAFVEFVGIIIYAIYHRVSTTGFKAKVKSRMQEVKISDYLKKMSGLYKQKDRNEAKDSTTGLKDSRVTSTVVNSPEASIEVSSDAYIELREPLIESLSS